MTYSIPLANLLLTVFSIIMFVAGFFIFIRDKRSIFHRAFKMAQSGDSVKAREIIQSRLTKNRNDPFPHYYMALVDSLEGKTDQVLNHLLEIKRIGHFEKEINPSDIFLKIGTIYYDQNKLNEAFLYFKEVIQIHPYHEASLAYLAFLSIGQREFNLAEKYFRPLVQTAPDVSEYHIARGVTQAMLNKKQKAITSLQKGVSLDPENETAIFLASLMFFNMRQGKKAYQIIRRYVEERLTMDPYISYIVHRLAAACCYMIQDYQKSLKYAQTCLSIVLAQEWREQERDSRISTFYQAFFAADYQEAEDMLLSLEVRDPEDTLILLFSDFRRELKEGKLTVEKISERGLDLKYYMKKWLKTRFSDDAIYELSGLEQEIKFDIPFSKEEQSLKNIFTNKIGRKKVQGSFIKQFNSLETLPFLDVCNRLISELGFVLQERLKYTGSDGANFLAKKKNNLKISALFQIRKWEDYPISDIFLRDHQSYMKEQQAELGFVIASSKLTIGAEQELNKETHITVVNEKNLVKLLAKIL